MAQGAAEENSSKAVQSMSKGWHKVRVNSRRWEKVRRQALDAAGYRCQDCGRAGRLECHHVQPVHLGGSLYDLDNVRPLCRDCHLKIHAVELDPDVQAWDDYLEQMG